MCGVSTIITDKIKMKKTSIFSVCVLLLFLFQAISLNAQIVFQKKYTLTTNVNGVFAGPSADGGIISCGYTNTTPYEAVLLKTNINGAIQWGKSYGGSNDDIFSVVRPTNDGGYIAVGYTKSFGAGGMDVLMVKFDASGTVSWSKTFGSVNDDWANDVIQTSDGGYAIIGGANQTTSVDDGSIYLIKTDNIGTLTWSKTWGSDNGDEGMTVVETADAGFMCFGHVYTGANVVIKTNSTGTISWVRNNRSYFMSSDLSTQTIPTSDGGYLMVGYGMSSSNDILISLVKVGASGVVGWYKTYRTPTHYVINQSGGVLEASDGSYLVTAITSDYPTGLMFLRVNSVGVVINAKVSTYLTPNFDNFLRLNKLADGYYAAAYTYSNGIFVLKCNEYGGTGATTSSISIVEDSPTFYDNLITTLTVTSVTVSTSNPTLTVANLTFAETTISVDIKEGNKDVSLVLYPNPTADVFQVQGFEGKATLNLYDLTGQLIFTKAIAADEAVSIGSLPQGVYVAKLIAADGGVWDGKVVKE